MAKCKKKCARGRFKSGKRKGHCKPAKAKKGGCKCTSLPGCVAYLRKAYKVKRRFAAGKKAATEERKLSSLYNG
jgi:hypothetical protein